MLSIFHCLNRCAIEEFKKSSDIWRSHAQTAAAMRSEFAELLADDDQPAQTAPAAQVSTLSLARAILHAWHACPTLPPLDGAAA